MGTDSVELGINHGKKLVKSKTFWGIIIAILPTILRLAGVPIPPGTAEVLTEVAVIAGGSLGIYGRVAATERIGR